MQEATRRHLKNLPKLHYEDLRTKMTESDVLYEYIAGSGDYGISQTVKIAKSSKVGLAYYVALANGKKEEIPIPHLEVLIYNIGNHFEELRTKFNISQNPLLKKDPKQRKLLLERGEVTLRYHLVRSDGTEYEVVR